VSDHADPGPGEHARRTAGAGGGDRPAPDELLHRAWAIRKLLDGTAPDDHAERIRLVAAQDAVRLEAARQWRGRGWRPITETALVPGPAPSLLVPPALAGIAAAALSVAMLGTARSTGLALALVAVVPLLAARVDVLRDLVRPLAGAAAVVLGTYVVTGAMPATLLFLPAASLLAAVALLGVARPDRR
jgi:hypothetical protein